MDLYNFSFKSKYRKTLLCQYRSMLSTLSALGLSLGSYLYCPKIMNDVKLQRSIPPYIHPHMGIQQRCLADSLWNSVRTTLSLTLVLTVSVSYCCCNKLPKLSGLKQLQFIILHFWRSEIWNESHWAAFLPGTLGENPLSFAFQLLEASHNPWPPSPTKPSNDLSLCQEAVSLVLTLLPPFPYVRTLGPTG